MTISGAGTTGVHHITAIAKDARRNLDFYTRVLGLRLVKKTVNFDDPGTYHLYFGDRLGNPGTILTFFPWANARRGVEGAGQTTSTAFAVPQGSLGFWQDRLAAKGVDVDTRERPFGLDRLRFRDPDGLSLELVEEEDHEAADPWTGNGVAAELAIRSFHSVTLVERAVEPTARLLTEQLGFTAAGDDRERYRFEAAGGAPARRVEIVHDASAPAGLVAGGSVHHVAWRVPDDAAQNRTRQRLLDAGLQVTPVVDRQYFRSIYFREPGGALFEVATDPPGFTWDEPADELGGELKLPPWYEPHRARIESVLPPLDPQPAATES